jgi:hypothetical protein
VGITRQKLGRLGTVTALAFAAAILTAGPAEARNIGGLTGVCVAPGHAVLGMHGPGLGANCICVIEPTTHEVLAGPTGPGSTCPAGVLRLTDLDG